MHNGTLKQGNGENKRQHGSSKKLVEKDMLKKETLKYCGGNENKQHGTLKKPLQQSRGENERYHGSLKNGSLKKKC